MAFKKTKSSAPNGAHKLSHETVIDLRDRLRKPGYISRVHYVNGGYRGTAENASTMDNIFVKTEPTLQAVLSPTHKGCAFLETDKGRVSPKQSVETFRNHVMTALHEMGVGPQTKLRVVSPAVELTYYAKPWAANACFVAELVFCYETKDEKIYYPQPPEGAVGSDLDLWTRARVSNERCTIVDDHNVIRRWSAQILRAMTTCDSTLRILTADVIEQAIHYVKRETPHDTWLENDLRRAVEMLVKFVTNAVQNNLLKKHSAISIGENVLPPMSGIMRDNVVRSLQKLSSEAGLQCVMEAL